MNNWWVEPGNSGLQLSLWYSPAWKEQKDATEENIMASAWTARGQGQDNHGRLTAQRLQDPILTDVSNVYAKICSAPLARGWGDQENHSYWAGVASDSVLGFGY